MRAFSALDSKLYSLRARKVVVRVWLGDRVTNLTDLNGTDWVESLTYGGNLDSPLTTCDINLRRDDGMFSLAPLNAQSKLNQGGALLSVNKLVIVDAAIVPEGTGCEFADAMGIWTEMWRGKVDNWDEASNPMTVQCRDISCEVADLFVEKLRAYAVGKSSVGVTVWYAGMYARVGDRVVPSAQPALGEDYTRVYVCTVSGLTGNNEPAWTELYATDVNDSTAVWQRADPVPAPWAASTTYLLGQTVVKAPSAGTSGAKFNVTFPPTSVTASMGVACDLKGGTALLMATQREMATGADSNALWAADAGHPAIATSYQIRAVTINAAGQVRETDPFTVSQVQCVGYPVWDALTVYNVGDRVSVDKTTGWYYECIQAHSDILPNGSLRWGYWADPVQDLTHTYLETKAANLVLSSDRPLKLDWTFNGAYTPSTFEVMCWRIYRSRSGGVYVYVGQTKDTSWIDYGTSPTPLPVYYIGDVVTAVTTLGYAGLVAGGFAGSSADPQGSRYFCVPMNGAASGVSGGTQPIWPVTIGVPSFADGTVKWILLPDHTDGGIAVESILNGMLVDNAVNLGTPVPYVWTPNSPGYWRNPFYVQQQMLLEAMQQLALEIGWDVRLKYNSAPTGGQLAHDWGDWRLCFSVPDRERDVSDFTLTSDEYTALPRLAQSVQTIRNVIGVAYCNTNFTFQSDGSPVREVYQEEDEASKAQYGRRYMGIAASLTNFVNTYPEAVAVARACLSDLKDPIVDAEVAGPYRWNVELGDIVQLTGNWYHFTGTQRLAVYGIAHTLSNKGECSTRLTLRGKPSLGVMKWLSAGVGPGMAKGIGKHPAGPSAGSIIADPAPTGAIIRFKPPHAIDGPAVGPPGPGQWAESELHLSVDAGFTPSAGTLVKRQGRSSTFSVAGLTPKTQLYGKVVLIDGAGQRSPPSAEFTVTPRQNVLGELDDGLKVAVAATGGDRTLDLPEPGVSGGVRVKVGMTALFDDDGFGGTTWDPATDLWTCPADGVYSIFCQVFVENLAAAADPLEYDAWGRPIGTVNLGLSFGRKVVEFPSSMIYGQGPFRDVNPGRYAIINVQGLAALSAGEQIGLYLDAIMDDFVTGGIRAYPSSNYFSAIRVWSR